MKTRTLRILGTFLFLSTLAMSQDRDYKAYDANNDGRMDRTEFDEMYNTDFSTWDSNQDKAIDDREFYDNTYRNLDQDRDNRLSQEEWDQGYDHVYGDYMDTNKYNQFDANSDGYVDNDEYYQGFRTTEFYSSYDRNRDGSLTQEELNSGVYKSMDKNKDGSINQNEYSRYSSYYTGRNSGINRKPSGNN